MKVLNIALFAAIIACLYAAIFESTGLALALLILGVIPLGLVRALLKAADQRIEAFGSRPLRTAHKDVTPEGRRLDRKVEFIDDGKIWVDKDEA